MENQATSTEELKKIIVECEKADSSLFNAPFTTNILFKFQNLIDLEFKKIKN